MSEEPKKEEESRKEKGSGWSEGLWALVAVAIVVGIVGVLALLGKIEGHVKEFNVAKCPRSAAGAELDWATSAEEKTCLYIEHTSMPTLPESSASETMSESPTPTLPPAPTATSTLPPEEQVVVPSPSASTPTPKPAAPAASAPTNSLKYDEMGCNADDLVACVPGEQAVWQADSANRHLFPAIYLRNVQSGDRSPSDAIVQIQQMASGWAKSWDKWTAFNADPRWPTLVWCPQRNCEYVPDTAFPLLNAPGVSSEWYYSIAIVSAHLPADPSASQTQVVCPSGDCWAVLLH